MRTDDREVALIESSNSLITFEYTGTVKGRNAEALSSITTGEIKTAIITSPGDGYTSRPNVDVISSSGFDGRVRALMGLLRVDVKTAGVGYSSPEVTVENVVEDDWVHLQVLLLTKVLILTQVKELITKVTQL